LLTIVTAYLVAEKYAKPLLEMKEIKSVLDRLDRLTPEESKMTVGLTYDIVCRLVNKMQVAMKGTHLKYV
jgi:hypothetical protein